MIPASPEYKKNMTKGETAEDAMIPPGMILPKSFMETGAVKSWALMLVPNDDAK